MEQGQTDAPTEQVASEVVTEQASPETAVEQAPVAPMAPAGERKKSNGAIIGMVIFALVALGGIGFGVWQMMQGSSKDKQIADLKTQVTNCANANNGSTESVTVTCPDGTAMEVVNNVITNDLAQNIISPYIDAFKYLDNLFDYDFDGTTKFVIAFKNLGPQSFRNNDGGIVMSYDTINSEYKALFGADSNIEKKDYVGACGNFTYYGEGNGALSNSFVYNVLGCGGTGSAMFSVVKDAKYDSGSVAINVYHDVVHVCFSDTDEKCVGTNVNSAIIDSIDQYNMQDYLEKYADETPVYTMTFVDDGGHYVLNNVQKQ